VYLGDRNKGPGHSGGWNRFVAYRGIKVGDVVIFQLVDSRKFKASSLAFHLEIWERKEGMPIIIMFS
jgi:hypothetical protein